MNGSKEEGAQGIAPDGWHIPSDSDWEKLYNYLGGFSVAGGKMKEEGTTHWNSPNEGATNSSGFTGLPAGCYSMGMFEGMGVGTHYWSSTEKGSNKTTVPTLHSESAEVLWFDVPKTFHHSIRCVKNGNQQKTTIPKDLNMTVPNIEIKINGKGPYRFDLDTGAPQSTISEKLTDEFGIKVIDEIEISVTLRSVFSCAFV